MGELRARLWRLWGHWGVWVTLAGIVALVGLAALGRPLSEMAVAAAIVFGGLAESAWFFAHPSDADRPGWMWGP